MSTKNGGPSVALVLAPATFFTLVALLTVIARVYTRIRLINNFGLDDWAIVMAMIAVLADLFTGIGILANDASRLNFVSFNQCVNAIGIIVVLFAQLSLLLTYRRLTPVSITSFRRVLYSIGGMVTFVSMLGLVLVISPCWPPRLLHFSSFYVDKMYNSRSVLEETPISTCWNPLTVLLILSGGGVFMNFVIFTLPFVLLQMANLKREQRRNLYGLFAFGGVVVLLGIIRVPYISVSVIEHGPEIYTSNRICVFIILYFGEANCMILAACIPTLKPLFRLLRGDRNIKKHKYLSGILPYRLDIEELPLPMPNVPTSSLKPPSSREGKITLPDSIENIGSVATSPSFRV